LNKLEAS